jgi:hypothetical protein
MDECLKRGLGRNEILAPEEPNVYSTVIINRITRAPAERNVFGHDSQVEHVSLLWSEERSFRSQASINISSHSSLGDEEDKSC